MSFTLNQSRKLVLQYLKSRPSKAPESFQTQLKLSQCRNLNHKRLMLGSAQCFNIPNNVNCQLHLGQDIGYFLKDINKCMFKNKLQIRCNALALSTNFINDFSFKMIFLSLTLCGSYLINCHKFIDGTFLDIINSMYLPKRKDTMDWHHGGIRQQLHR